MFESWNIGHFNVYTGQCISNPGWNDQVVFHSWFVALLFFYIFYCHFCYWWMLLFTFQIVENSKKCHSGEINYNIFVEFMATGRPQEEIGSTEYIWLTWPSNLTMHIQLRYKCIFFINKIETNNLLLHNKHSPIRIVSASYSPASSLNQVSIRSSSVIRCSSAIKINKISEQ